jgi:hypothetical protein
MRNGPVASATPGARFRALANLDELEPTFATKGGLCARDRIRTIADDRADASGDSIICHRNAVGLFPEAPE